MAMDMAEVMEKVKVCKIVDWWEEGVVNGHPRPAVITRVNTRSLALNIMDPQNQNLMLREGVRFHEDPEAKEDEFAAEGSWSFTDESKRLATLETKLQNTYTKCYNLEEKVKLLDEKLTRFMKGTAKEAATA